ncbi:hypothetical protein TSAR_003581 [Trichomalopsis sarcophagae]|uniref:Uncharacterized protein n=1 Tax=Trichomalopsis sarcophagae TaxID=543379 RepID=A0A232EPE7_9HYME|nr:hypothetical protein TSAR_003581 [Trichomalopsis sarcophagae]
MRSIAAILLAAFLLASYQGQMAGADDWLSNLLSGVNAQVEQINRNVNQQVSRINQDVQAQVARVNEDVQAQVARAQEAAKNAKPGEYSVNQGNTVIINGNRGYYRTVNSGVDSEGRPYSIEIEDRVKDGVLRHTERIYNATTKRYQTFVSERKLSDPQAEPIFNNFTTTSQT